MSNKYFGKCALCKKETNLTFEHIPPRGALNSQRTKIYTGDESFSLMIGADGRLPWETDGLRYKNQQSGMGLYSLCSQCNNMTGTNYGNEYIKFATGIYYLIKELDPNSNDFIEIKGIEFYPLRFIKQVVSMFLSINNGFFDDSLRDFVLNKESTFFNQKKYKIFLYFVCDGAQRLLPYTVKGVLGENNFTVIGASEITTYPLGFVLLVDPPESYDFAFTDITEFCDCCYDQKKKYDMVVPVYKANSLIPFDFRSKDEILQCIDDNKKWTEDHENELK